MGKELQVEKRRQRTIRERMEKGKRDYIGMYLGTYTRTSAVWSGGAQPLWRRCGADPRAPRFRPNFLEIRNKSRIQHARKVDTPHHIGVYNGRKKEKEAGGRRRRPSEEKGNCAAVGHCQSGPYQERRCAWSNTRYAFTLQQTKVGSC